MGGSGGDSCSDKEGAGPVGSRVGGGGSLESSVREKENLLEHFRKSLSHEPANDADNQNQWH